MFYQANRRCPIFAELQGLVVKTAGVADVLRAALAAAGYRATHDSHHYRVIQFLLDRMRYAERVQGGTHLWGARKEARKG